MSYCNESNWSYHILTDNSIEDMVCKADSHSRKMYVVHKELDKKKIMEKLNNNYLQHKMLQALRMKNHELHF